MKLLKYFTLFTALICIAAGCKKDQQFTDTSLLSTVSSANNLGMMYNITHDNTGIVTITPNANGALSYDVYFGDSDPTSGKVGAGASIQHTYKEGTFQVKLVAHDLKGGTTTFTQPLTVSFLQPQNLDVTTTVANLTATVTATAKYATFFKISFGDSTATNPVPSTFALGGAVTPHTYKSTGTYTITVVALSGGSETLTKTTTVTVSTPLNLPITFEDPNVNYAFGDFAGENTSLVIDPTDNSNHVAKSVKTPGALTYAGVTLGSNGFPNPLPLTVPNHKMTVRVYSPAAGIDVKLKLDNHANGNNGLSVETDVLTTKASQWETLTFDFTKNSAGTPAFNPANTYDNVTLFFDFGNTGTGSTFYFDDIEMVIPPVLKQIDMPVTFDDPTVNYTPGDFAGNNSILAFDPTNSANVVMKSVKTNGALTYAGTTLGGNGFAHPITLSQTRLKLTVMVYSPAAGIDVKLKLDNHLNSNNGLSVETDVLTTKAGQWETLTFDMSQNSAGTPAYNSANTYDTVTIFFDFGNAGKGDTYYWDNVILL